MRKTDVTPVGLVMTKDGKTAFVTLGHAAHVAVVDVPTRKIQGYILVGKRSWGITLSRDESKLYRRQRLRRRRHRHRHQEPQGDRFRAGRPHSLGRGDR